ncbi:MAG: efflux RND transporter permease subunit [bacterium]
MRKLIEFSVHHPVTMAMVLLIPIVFGIFSAFQMPVDMLPEINAPTLVVTTNYSGTGPEEMEKLITRPMEEAFSRMKDLKKVSSVTTEGKSTIIVEYDWGKDMDIAAMDVREQIDKIKNLLPSESEKPVIQRFDPNAWPIIWINLSGPQESYEVRKTAEDVFKNAIEQIPGVASVEITGGKEKEIQIQVETKKLLAYNLTLQDISQAIKIENLNMRAGKVEEGRMEFLVRTIGEFSSIDNLKKLIVSNKDNNPIYLKDVADVLSSYKDVVSYSRLNKQDSVGMLIFKESGGNTVEISDLVLKKLESIKKQLPAGMVIDIVFDQADYIRDSLKMVNESAVSGSILAVFILFLFLIDWRSTSIISLSIPISVFSTIGALYLSKITLNILSLAGLALGIGMVVDNSIVVLENTFRHINLNKENPVHATIEGTAEVAMPILSSTITTIVVFLPLAFVKGIAGEIFFDLSFSIAFSLVFSIIVSYTVVPMATAILFKRKKHAKETKREEKFFKIIRWTAGTISIVIAYLGMGYSPLTSLVIFIMCFIVFKFRLMIGTKILDLYKDFMVWLLGKRVRQAGALLTLLVFFILSLTIKPGMQFFPPGRQKLIRGDVELKPGASLNATDNIAREMEEIIHELPEVVTSAINVTPQKADITIKVDETKGRQIPEIINVLNEKSKNFPDANIKLKRMEGFRHGEESDISIKIIGEDLTRLKEIGGKLLAEIKAVPDLKDFDISIKEALPEVQVIPNRAKISDLGLNTQYIAHTLQTSIDGEVASTYWDKNDEIDIRLRLKDANKQNIDFLNTIPLTKTLLLGNVAHVVKSAGPLKIERENQVRSVSVTANLKEGLALGDTMQKLSNKNRTGFVDTFNFPPGYSWHYGGQGEEMMESFKYLMFALIESLVLIYMVMAAQFESFGHPFLIMFTMPMAFIGVTGGLLISRDKLSITAMVGIIMLAGIVVNNAILLIDYINVLRKEGMERKKATVQAGVTRMRPIFMTTLTTVLGMLPMALGIGAGVEFYKALAVVVIGGLTFSTGLTLIVIPILYNIFEAGKVKIFEGVKSLIRGE